MFGRACRMAASMLHYLKLMVFNDYATAQRTEDCTIRDQPPSLRQGRCRALTKRTDPCPRGTTIHHGSESFESTWRKLHRLLNFLAQSQS